MQSDPSKPPPLVVEALRLDREGRVLEAIQAYREVLSQWPFLADCWCCLAVLERQAGQYAAALNSYQQALDTGVKRPEQVHLNRGVIFSDDLHQEDRAEAELNAAVALNANYVPAHVNMANIYENRGDRSAASAAYEKILILDPDSALALARFCNAHTFISPADPLIKRLEFAIAQPGRSFAQRADLGFALGRALDMCGAFVPAFEAYVSANRNSRASVNATDVRYDRLQVEQFFDRVIAAYPSRIEPFQAATLVPRPIFICGMFRSGSTLVEQLLAGHPRITAGGELDLVRSIAESEIGKFPEGITTVSYERLQHLSTQYVNALAGFFPGSEIVTDKRPDNFLYIGLIKRLFPNAQIVHTARNSLDNCLSIFFLHLRQSMSYALDLADTGHYYRQYFRLMAHWKVLFGRDIVEIDYETLVNEPEDQIRRLLNLLALEWSPQCLVVPPTGRSVKTASVWQVREPIHNRSSGRSKHYARELESLRAYLNEVS